MSWNRVAVVGAGLIKMGELFDQSYEQMAAGAFAAAVASVDKGFEPDLVDAAFVATQRGTLWGQEGIGGNTIPTAIGLVGIPCTRIENACPSGSDAFRVGAMASPAACTMSCWSSASRRCATSPPRRASARSRRPPDLPASETRRCCSPPSPLAT
jgi:hypothetical protein